jgi:hypothetical protein
VTAAAKAGVGHLADGGRRRVTPAAHLADEAGAQ